MKTKLNITLVVLLSLITACGDGKKVNNKSSVACGSNTKFTTDEASIDDYFDGQPGFFKLIRLDYYINIDTGNYVGGKTLFTEDKDVAISPQNGIECSKIVDLQEGALTLNLDVPVLFNRQDGTFNEIYKETIEKHGPKAKADNTISWSVVNANGSIFDAKKLGYSLRKGTSLGEFILVMSASESTKIGQSKFVSKATYKFVE